MNEVLPKVVVFVKGNLGTEPMYVDEEIDSLSKCLNTVLDPMAMIELKHSTGSIVWFRRDQIIAFRKPLPSDIEDWKKGNEPEKVETPQAPEPPKKPVKPEHDISTLDQV